MDDSIALLSINRIQVLGANLISGELTWGFPSPTAFLGFTHALERRLCGRFDVRFGGVGIVCHKAVAQTSEDPKYRSHQLRLTRNPLDKDGTLPSLVEVGRLHMRISLVIEVNGDWVGEEDEIAREVSELLPAMRIAGGSVFPSRADGTFEIKIEGIPDSDSERREHFRKNRYRFLPGFALYGREEILAEHLKELQARSCGNTVTELDALLDLSRRNEFSQKQDDPADSAKSVIRKERPGWLVPIAVGYQAISPLYQPGQVLNARNAEYPFQFVESIYSIAEWRGLHRIEKHDEFMWRRSHADEEVGVYRCISSRATAQKENR